MRWLILLALIYVIWRLTRFVLPKAGSTRPAVRRGGDHGDDEMVQDPVCGVFFPKREGVILDQGGVPIHFCSNACKDKYIHHQSQ